MFQEEKSMIDNPFPANANVRLLISGLAFCTLNPDLSEINFLGHVAHHELSLTIVKRNEKEAKKTELKIIIKAPTKISLGSADNPTEYDTIQADGEKSLKPFINMQKLHGKPLDLKENGNKDELTTLSVNNCAFYTDNVTRDKFKMIDEKGDRSPIYPDDMQVGYVMGGKMNCAMTGETILSFAAPYNFEIKLPHTESNTEYVYDLIFNNHCIQIEKCKEDIGENDTDFKYYYEVLKESGDTDKKYKLLPVGEQTAEVAACNVVIVDPPESR